MVVMESPLDQRFKRLGRRVLLFSGGMDSLILNYLYSPDVLLFIKHGSTYEKFELENLDRLTSSGWIDSSKLVFLSDCLDLSRWERVDMIIPCRNLFFICFASMYGEEILLGSVRGDRSTDKDYFFFSQVVELLNHIYSESHWCEGRKFKVWSPIKHLTKTEAVREYLQEGGPVEPLLLSRSCYETTDKPCGWCKPCFRKWVALVNNRIGVEGYFENNPWEAPWLPELLPRIRKGEYRGQKEDSDICRALETVGVL